MNQQFWNEFEKNCKNGFKNRPDLLNRCWFLHEDGSTVHRAISVRQVLAEKKITNT
jgi:hypothetical protein